MRGLGALAVGGLAEAESVLAVYTGIPVYRYTGIPVYRYIGIGISVLLMNI